MIRQYKFKVGDKVNFIEEDEYIGRGMGERHRAQHRAGPYEIEATEEVRSSFGGPTQLVYVNGHCYSGLWFKPVEVRDEVERALLGAAHAEGGEQA